MRRYVSAGRRIDFKEETKLAVDAEEQRAVLERQASHSGASTPSYHFICEAFFLTAKGLHLGLVKMIQDLYNLARVSPFPSAVASFACSLRDLHDLSPHTSLVTCSHRIPYQTA